MDAARWWISNERQLGRTFSCFCGHRLNNINPYRTANTTEYYDARYLVCFIGATAALFPPSVVCTIRNGQLMCCCGQSTVVEADGQGIEQRERIHAQHSDLTVEVDVRCCILAHGTLLIILILLIDDGMEEETHYKLLNCWEAQEIPAEVNLAERRRQLERIAVLSATPFKDPICTAQTDMPFYEEVIVMVCWLTFFAIPLWGPFVLAYMLYLNVTYGLFLLALAVAISRIPSPHNPKLCYHYLASLTLKYFSFRAIWKNTLPKGTYIGVTPPHGLFPIAGMLGVFALPRFIIHSQCYCHFFIMYF